MTYENFVNPSIGFKMGSQDNLNTLIKQGGAVEGVFYLTNDTHRLYIGRKKSSDNKIYPVPVNEGITTVDKVSSLPTSVNVGEFYYVTEENILCVYNGNSWVQLNPDTRLKSNEQNISIEKNSTDKTITITSIVEDSREDANKSKGSYVIKEGNNITLTLDENKNEITIAANESTHLEDDSYNIAVETKDNVATVTGTIKDSAENDSSDAFSIKGLSNVSISSTNNEIHISAIDTKVEDFSITNKTDEDGGFEFVVKNSTDEDGLTATLNPEISYGDGSKTIAKFNNGTATLDIYTKEETDTKIAEALTSADAMVFKGVLGDGFINVNSLTGTANAGDTYKVGTSGKYFEIDCKEGDLLISKKDGASYSNKEDWYYIPSGDDQVIGGIVNESDNSIQIQDHNNTFAGLKLKASSNNDKGVEISSIKNGSILETTISHKAYNTSSEKNDSSIQVGLNTNDYTTYTAITGIETSNGHITKITTTDLQIKDTDTHNQIKSVTMSGSELSNANGVEISTTITTSDKETITNTGLSVKSDSLDIKMNGSAATIDLVWGAF